MYQCSENLVNKAKKCKLGRKEEILAVRPPPASLTFREVGVQGGQEEDNDLEAVIPGPHFQDDFHVSYSQVSTGFSEEVSSGVVETNESGTGGPRP